MQMSRTNLIVAGLTVLGLFLRIAAADNDLWLDEIASLNLVGDLAGPHEVFTHLLHDNNHHLNSLYLYLVGDTQSPLGIRSFSILAGTLSIPAAAWAVRPYGPLAAILAAALMCFSYPMIHYGSEARGYAGLILCTMLAFGAVEHNQRSGMPEGGRILLAAVTAIGMLFHLTMLFSLFCALLWVFLRNLVRQKERPLRALADTLHFAVPAMLATLGAFILILAPIYLETQHGFAMGGRIPFDWQHFLSGYASMLALTIGFSAVSATMLVPVFLAVTFGFGARTDHKAVEPVLLVGAVALVGLPLLMALLQLPNLGMRRYFLFAAVSLLFCLPILLSRLIAAGGMRRTLTIASLAVIAASSGLRTLDLLEYGRGQYTRAIATMKENGPAQYTTRPRAAVRTKLVVDYYEQLNGSPASLEYVPPANRNCAAPADWFLDEFFDARARPVKTLQIQTGSCTTTYDLKHVYRDSGMAGIGWALYAPAEPAGRS